MRLNSLPLLTYLLSEQGRRRSVDSAGKSSLFFFVGSDPPQAVETLEGTRAIFSRRGFSRWEGSQVATVSQEQTGQSRALVPPQVSVRQDITARQDNWWRTGFWTSFFNSQFPGQRGGIAVFSCSLEEIPPFAFEALLQHKFADLIYLSFGQWRRIDLLRRRALTLSLWRRKIEMAISAVMESAELTLRKVLLKYLSVPLVNASGAGFINEPGTNAFCVPLPNLAGISDTVGLERSPLVLFEEKTMLQGHQPMDLIRTHGLGRFTHWEQTLLFSSSDNSNPNGNGRRYRYILFSGWRKLLRPLFNISDTFNITEQLRLVSEKVLDQIESEWKPARLDKPHRLGAVLREKPAESFERYVQREVESDAKRGAALLGDARDETCMLIGSLAAGGSERQLCYLTRGLRQDGRAVRILLPEQQSEAGLHYYPMIERYDVPLTYVSHPSRTFSLNNLANRAGLEDLWLFEGMPAVFVDEVFAVYTHLMELRPRILHCWLDHMNVVGAIAGWLAGVPQIVLSARSVNPTHFPPLFRDWYQNWYKLMLRSPRIKLTANSRAGAESYAEWIGISPDAVRVVHNGMETELFRPAGAEAIQAVRREIGISPEAPLVCGVMRFTAEKRPLRFVRLIAELSARMPDVHAILVGDGPLRNSVERDLENLGLTSRVKILGRRDDVPRLIGAADLLLLTSYMEGLPNVLMEAQLLERPVVAPRVGGIPEVVADGIGGYLCEKDDIQGTVAKLEQLLRSPGLRLGMGSAGRQWVESNFSLAKMIRSFEQVYGVPAQVAKLPSPELGSQSSGPIRQLASGCS